MDATGIGQRPEEIEFHDINGDGRADYVWTNAMEGRVRVWLNNYPNQPPWLEQGEIATGVGTSGACVRWAVLQHTGRASYLAVDPNNAAVSAWLNGCDSNIPPQSHPPPAGTTCLTVGECAAQWSCPPPQQLKCVGEGSPVGGLCECQ
jgi:hypothetical protein